MQQISLHSYFRNRASLIPVCVCIFNISRLLVCVCNIPSFQAWTRALFFVLLPSLACECSHVGNNCDTNTGQCICPPNTIGERCDRCTPNHWGHDIVTGCKVSPARRGVLLHTPHKPQVGVNRVIEGNLKQPECFALHQTIRVQMKAAPALTAAGSALLSWSRIICWR